MRTSDTIEQAWGNLWKKKLRTFLTISGVVISVGALVTMFAFGQGVQQNIKRQFDEMELFNYINVSVRGRPHGPGGRRRGRPRPRRSEVEPNEPNGIDVKPLDDTFLAEVAQIEGVESAIPEIRFPAEVRFGGREQFTFVQVIGAKTSGLESMNLRAGQLYQADDPNEMIISDSLLHRLGCKEPETAVGREVEVRTVTLDFGLGTLFRMAFGKGGSGLPISNQRYKFRIVAVAGNMGFGGPMPIRSDVYIPPGVARDMKKISVTSLSDFFAPPEQMGGYATVSIKVTSPSRVAEVKEELERRGYKTFALMDQLDEMRTGFIIMDMFLLAVGMIGITVASLGIVNTMVMTILERYREIGIMKAVGATDGDIQKIFLFESGMIGLLGGLFGLLLACVVSFIINQVINGFASREGVPFIHYFNFSWWLCLAAIAFSIFISLLAGLYPTRRAARVNPVVALRHD